MLYATGKKEEAILKMVDATNNDDADMWASVFAKDAICYMDARDIRRVKKQSPAEAGQFFGVTDPDVWCFPTTPFKNLLLDRDDVVGFEYMIIRKGGTDRTTGYMQLNFDADDKITSAMVDNRE